MKAEKDNTRAENGLTEQIKIDFSAESREKEAVFQRLLIKLNEENHQKREWADMKKSLFKPVAAALAAVILLGGFASTSLGQELWRIVKEVAVGEHAQYVVEERAAAHPPAMAVPEELKGQLYDGAGNVLEVLPNEGSIYNQEGQELVLSFSSYQDENGETIEILEALTFEESRRQEIDEMTVLADIEAAKPYLAFDFSLPGYLPQGYAFDRIQLFNDENGKPVENCEYAYVYFSNGDPAEEIYLQLRLMNEKTAYTAGLGDIEKIEINGHEGVIGEGHVDAEIDGVMYMLMAGRSGINNGELLKMMESVGK